MYTLREELNTTGRSTLPVVLQRAGYQTAVIGKWHMHGDNTHGFDYYAITRGQGAYFNPSFETPDGKRRCQGHATDVYTDVSLEWLARRDKDRPFFLMCHHKAAHGLWQPAKRHAKLYEGVKLPEPKTFWDDFDGRTLGAGTKSATVFPALTKQMQGGKKGQGWPTGDLDVTGLDEKQQKKAAFQKYAKDYLRCVAGIDESVGRLYQYLKDEGILDNTLVIYTSDQGMFVGEHGFYDKRLMLDEALKMPFIARFPKAIRGAQISDAIVNNVDFAPTLIDSCGLETPAEMQGKSFWPLLQGKVKHTRNASFYAFYSNGVARHYGIRTKQHKLILYGDGSTRELYDLKADPYERINQYVNSDYADVVRAMETTLQETITEVDIEVDELPSAQVKTKAPRVKKQRRRRKAEL
jgi:arylsulfatase A-like enzyme